MVATYHLLGTGISIGIYPVFGFYIISGYLMTLIIHDRYGFSLSGKIRFFTNRALRLYPLYWFSASISVILLILVGEVYTTQLNKAINTDFSTRDYFQNITMIFINWLPIHEQPRLVPPTWALTVEIFFYILIGLGISRKRKFVLFWLSCAAIYAIGTIILGQDWRHRYFPLPGAAFPFALGALTYFVRQTGARRVFQHYNLVITAILFGTFLANAIFFGNFAASLHAGLLLPEYVGFYLNAVIVFTLLLYILEFDERSTNKVRQFGRSIGDFSYPIYLLHWQVGIISFYILDITSPGVFAAKGASTFSLTLFLLIPICWAALKVIDAPVQRLRRTIRPGQVSAD